MSFAGPTSRPEVRVIAQGPVREVYTAQNLRAAYGRHLALIAAGEEPRA